MCPHTKSKPVLQVHTHTLTRTHKNTEAELLVTLNNLAVGAEGIVTFCQLFESSIDKFHLVLTFTVVCSLQKPDAKTEASA